MAVPDRPFHNSKASRSENGRILCISEHHATDFEAAELWKGRSGISGNLEATT